MTQDRTPSNSSDLKAPYQKKLAESYYALLGVHPSASARDIRQAYRDLSKLYHPDTTTLPTAIATSKFQQLNEAYATLSSPERRTVYDRKIGYSSVAVVQSLPSLHRPAANQAYQSSSAYLDATDRPLSPGEVFALFILGLTFLGCLCLAIAIGLTRGDAVLPLDAAQLNPAPHIQPQVQPQLPQDAPANLARPNLPTLVHPPQSAPVLPATPSAPPPLAPLQTADQPPVLPQPAPEESPIVSASPPAASLTVPSPPLPDPSIPEPNS